LGRQSLWLILASLILAAFGIAQTSLALHSLNAKIGLSVGFFERPANVLDYEAWAYLFIFIIFKIQFSHLLYNSVMSRSNSLSNRQ
jgi:hypothetical protein